MVIANKFTNYISLAFRLTVFIFYIYVLFIPISLFVWSLNSESLFQTIKEVFLFSFYFYFDEYIDIKNDNRN